MHDDKDSKIIRTIGVIHLLSEDAQRKIRRKVEEAIRKMPGVRLRLCAQLAVEGTINIDKIVEEAFPGNSDKDSQDTLIDLGLVERAGALE